jgi:CDP-diacylglycerol--glycerol-3-phosphate 3-phosphatidyltransferase
MNGLYALKPWYARRLAGPRAVLVRRDVSPHVVSWTGVGFAAAAGASLALMSPGPAAAAVVGALLAGRLACANLDGGIARQSGRATAWGGVVNELSDRVADLCALAGLAAVAPTWLVAVAALASLLPAYTGELSARHGALTPSDADTSGGKTERCVLLVVAAAFGHAAVVAAVIAVSGVVAAGVRLGSARRALAGAR